MLQGNVISDIGNMEVENAADTELVEEGEMEEGENAVDTELRTVEAEPVEEGENAVDTEGHIAEAELVIIPETVEAQQQQVPSS